MEMIKLNEVLKIMKSGELFEITFVSCDQKRKTGGFKRSFQAKQNLKLEKKKPSDFFDKNNLRISKNPNHYKHATRSLKIYVDGIATEIIRKCHIFLITEFNGKRVYL